MPPRDADSSEGGTVILLVCGGVAVISWPLAPQPRPDLALIDELARLQLVARRLGCHDQVAARRSPPVGAADPYRPRRHCDRRAGRTPGPAGRSLGRPTEQVMLKPTDPPGDR